MKVLFAGGGTAGHINPAIAIAGHIKAKEKNAELLYVGAKGALEERLVPEAGIPFKSVTISGFKRSLSPKAFVGNIRTVKRIFSSGQQAKKIIGSFKPDICVGTGGYVSGPLLRTAAKMGIPIVILEQNAYPGLTTKMLAKYAKKIMLAVPETKEHFKDGCSFATTGNPVRQEVLFKDKRESRVKLGLDERPVVLSFGGSMGARRLNEAMLGILARSAGDKKYRHIHAYGGHSTWFMESLKERGADPLKCDNIDVREYINDMPDCLAAADLVISRAGAIALSEIQVCCKPSILIPSPNVAENHQYHNAMVLANKKAAVVIEEKDLTEQTLIKEIDRLLSDPVLLKEYSKNAGSMAVYDANERIYAVIKSVLSR